mmetsp:Transcript_113197/g.320679  ORF Transcript_113197/g.320679 Transcript_113197/m.320679 type:complete len:438 (+) Transcript_113197:517-1830(+)
MTSVMQAMLLPTAARRIRSRRASAVPCLASPALPRSAVVRPASGSLSASTALWASSTRCFSLTMSRLPVSSCTVTWPTSTFSGSEGSIVTAWPLYSRLCMVRRYSLCPGRKPPGAPAGPGGLTSARARFPTNSSGGTESSDSLSSLGARSSFPCRTARVRPDCASFTVTRSFLTSPTFGTTVPRWPLYSARDRPFSMTVSPTASVLAAAAFLPRGRILWSGGSESSESVAEAPPPCSPPGPARLGPCVSSAGIRFTFARFTDSSLLLLSSFSSTRPFSFGVVPGWTPTTLPCSPFSPLVVFRFTRTTMSSGWNSSSNFGLRVCASGGISSSEPPPFFLHSLRPCCEDLLRNFEGGTESPEPFGWLLAFDFLGPNSRGGIDSSESDSWSEASSRFSSRTDTVSPDSSSEMGSRSFGLREGCETVPRWPFRIFFARPFR